MEVLERDLLGRVTAQHTVEDGTTRMFYSSTLLGQLDSIERAGTSTGFEYDSLGRLSATTRNDGVHRWRTEQTYDAAGRVLETRYPSLDTSGRGGVMFRTRNVYGDGLAQVQRIEMLFGGDGLARWTNVYSVDAFDVLGRPSQTRHANGVFSERLLEPGSGLIANIRGDAFTQTIERDQNDNTLARTTVFPSASHEEKFEYDALSRMTEWSSDVFGTRAYDHDAHGNLVVNGGVTQRFGEGGAGPHQMTGIDYDERGRRVRDATTKYTAWTAEGLPRHIQAATGTLDVRYDAFGRRVRTDAGTESVSYSDERYELHESASRSGATTREVFRIHADGLPVAEFHATHEGHGSRGGSITGTLYGLHTDHQGTVAAITDARGNVVDHHLYEPHGQRQSASSAPLSSRGFTGHEHDAETGLVSMRGRMFDPATGQFLSPDPVIRNPLANEALGAYSYVENNPGTWTDPTGLYAGSRGGVGPGADLTDGDIFGAIVTGIVGGIASFFNEASGGQTSAMNNLGPPARRGSPETGRARAPGAPAVADTTRVTNAITTAAKRVTIDALSWVDSNMPSGRGAHPGSSLLNDLSNRGYAVGVQGTLTGVVGSGAFIGGWAGYSTAEGFGAYLVLPHGVPAGFSVGGSVGVTFATAENPNAPLRGSSKAFDVGAGPVSGGVAVSDSFFSNYNPDTYVGGNVSLSGGAPGSLLYSEPNLIPLWTQREPTPHVWDPEPPFEEHF